MVKRPPVAGFLDTGWTAWFEGLDDSKEGTETTISGTVADEAAPLVRARLASGTITGQQVPNKSRSRGCP